MPMIDSNGTDKAPARVEPQQKVTCGCRSGLSWPCPTCYKASLPVSAAQPATDDQTDCPHNALRKKRDDPPEVFDAYVCGNCAAMFEVKLHVEPSPVKEPMFDRRPPWGSRSRQA